MIWGMIFTRQYYTQTKEKKKFQGRNEEEAKIALKDVFPSYSQGKERCSCMHSSLHSGVLSTAQGPSLQIIFDVRDSLLNEDDKMSHKNRLD